VIEMVSRTLCFKTGWSGSKTGLLATLLIWHSFVSSLTRIGCSSPVHGVYVSVCLQCTCVSVCVWSSAGWGEEAN